MTSKDVLIHEGVTHLREAHRWERMARNGSGITNYGLDMCLSRAADNRSAPHRFFALAHGENWQ